MGNFMTEFETQVEMYDQLYLQKRDQTIITNQHQYLTPVPLSILPQTSYSEGLRQTVAAKHFQITQAPPAIQPFNVRPEHTMPLDLTFYKSLCLPSYSFKSNNNNFKITQQIDRFGVKYVGEWNLNKPHGNGVLISNISKYIGTFDKGMKSKHGRQIYAQEVYQGSFLNDLRQGEGIKYTLDRMEKGIFDKGNFVRGQIKYYDRQKIQEYDASAKIFIENDMLYSKLSKIQNMTDISSLPMQWK